MVSTFGLFLFELKREPDNFPAAAGERSFSMNNKVVNGRKVINTISKSKIISRRQGGGDEAYYTYVEEADDPGMRRAGYANKDSALI